MKNKILLVILTLKGNNSSRIESKQIVDDGLSYYESLQNILRSISMMSLERPLAHYPGLVCATIPRA